METSKLKAKTKKEVAEEIGFSVKTLSRKLKKANIRIPRGLIDPRHLKMIYDIFDVPKGPEKA